ncbi:MAG: hypothetical protein RDU14_10100 [Melioribacteraceae bacterium]|nr:hypothetical protein [Melioribacteraceae bacterium]
MSDIKIKTNALIELLDLLGTQLNSITTENFSENFKISLETMMVIKSKKKELAQKFGISNLAKYDPEMLIRAKLIERTYDNIIGKFRKELNKTEKQIFHLNRQKKITNYIR